jgi:hypothetical protein
MQIHGWEKSAISNTFGVNKKPNVFSSQAENAIQSDVVPLLENDTYREELLQKIKQRIKTGFYNSDAVIDDIGYGFAQALDKTL